MRDNYRTGIKGPQWRLGPLLGSCLLVLTFRRLLRIWNQCVFINILVAQRSSLGVLMFTGSEKTPLVSSLGVFEESPFISRYDFSRSWFRRRNAIQNLFWTPIFLIRMASARSTTLWTAVCHSWTGITNSDCFEKNRAGFQLCFWFRCFANTVSTM